MANATTPVIQINEGNVGIGTTGPNTKLHVSGYVRATSGVYFNSTSTTGFKIENNSTNNELNIYSGSLTPGITINTLGHLKLGNYGMSGSGTPTKFLGLDSNLNVVTYTSGSVLPGGPYLPLAGGTLTGDLTVSGGDITLGGTGRIQGIDTVSASTDAANKAYVDAKSVGILTLASANGITVTGGTTANATVGVNYTAAADNLVHPATTISSLNTGTSYGTYFLCADSNPGITYGAVSKIRTGYMRLNKFGAPDGSISMNNQLITDLGTPILSSNASNKAYVDTKLSLVGGTMSNTNLVTNMNADLLDGKHKPTNFSATSQTYTTIATGQWDLPTGSSVFSKADSVGGPGAVGYWYVTGRRDVSGGYGGIYSSYSSGQHWFGYNSLGTANPTWDKIWTDKTFTPGNYLPLTGGTLTGDLSLPNLTSAGYVGNNSAQTRDKLRVWGSSLYTIGMKSGYTFGGLGGDGTGTNDYAMSFQMSSGTPNRGWWWGDSSDTDAQGSMALTTDGRLSVPNAMRLGHGTSDTTSPGSSSSPYVLSVYGGYGNRIISTQNIALTVQGGGNGTDIQKWLNTSGTAVTVIDNTGKIGMNVANPVATLDMISTTGGYSSIVQQMEIPSYGTGLLFNRSASGSYNYTAMSFRYNGSTVGGITINTTSISISYSSDYRLKENREDISDAIERVKELKPVKFNWIKEPGKSKVDGFYAHELAEVVPEAVVGEKDALDWEGNPHYQSIDPTKIVPLLTAALQQAIDKIEELELRINKLEK